MLLGLLAVPVPAADPSPPTLSLLIVDGMNNHDWRRATGILKEILVSSGRFTMGVSTSPPANASKEAWDTWRPEFDQYDVVLSNFNGGHKQDSLHWPTEVEKALEDYVNGGGGLVIYHSANNSFPNWTAYNEMIGLGWRDKDFGPSLIVSQDEKVLVIPKGEGRNPGHGPEHDFQVTVLNRDHPITKGLTRKWMHPHEQLTHGQHGPAKNVTVLSYAHSKDTGDNEVMDWVIPYGNGRVYVTMLGHLWKSKPDTAMRCIGFQTMLIRGCEWAATERITHPVPEDFPTATEIRMRAAATMRKPEDRVTEHVTDGGTVFSIHSPSGIGSATIAQQSWSDHVRLRLHLRGLEGLTISNRSVTLKVSVLSHSGNPRHLGVVEDGEKKVAKKGSPYWTEIRAFDGKGKPVQGLPEEGGYFEIELPAALFTSKPKSLTIDWIDFYRQ
ncbi:MAG: ThuA domain-containing protein [Planctomycetota bacterium]